MTRLENLAICRIHTFIVSRSKAIKEISCCALLGRGLRLRSIALIATAALSRG